MKNNNRCVRLLFIVGTFTLGIATSANAALLSRLNGQAVYDTDLNITWLADADLAASNTFGVSGIVGNAPMYGSTAQQWIAAMNAANYLGFSDWRLPTTSQPDPTCSLQVYNGGGFDGYGYNCTGSEMGHLFYKELGGTAGQSILNSSNPNLSLFTNIQTDTFYWSGTEPLPSSAWAFNFVNGYQNQWVMVVTEFAWAVRTGDVAAVPVPATFWLFGSGLIGLFRFVHRRKAT
jgi:hypothetical protein